MSKARKTKVPNPQSELRKARAAANKGKWENPFFLLFRSRHPDLPIPEREYKFAMHLGRHFKADFCWTQSDVRLICELDGGGAKSRHSTVTGYANDCDKLNLASGILHYRVVRFNVVHLKNMIEVVDFVARLVRNVS